MCIRDSPYGVHHYEISQSSGGDWVKIFVESDVIGASSVTNMEYEEQIQNKKSKIRLLKPSFLQQFSNEFQRLLGQKRALL